ncbi:MAG: hypothetical protein AAGG06_19475, partial [Pseudomonadota bacterium]
LGVMQGAMAVSANADGHGLDARTIAERACAAEIFAHGRAACIGQLADGRLLAMETRLGSLTAGIEGARAETLLAVSEGVRDAQHSWQIAMEMFCQMAGARLSPERQICRLDKTLERETQLGAALETAFAPLGGIPGSPSVLGAEVEVFVPIDQPPGGPADAVSGAFVDLPIWFR